jgi:hypothetical protein
MPAQASSIVSLHDHDNIEIKTITELSAAPSSVETDIYLFVPKNFELPAFGKHSLVNDFRSRIRIALPVVGESGIRAVEDSIERMRTCLDELKVTVSSVSSVGSVGSVGFNGGQSDDFNQALIEPALEAAKDLATVVADTLKHRANEHSREFLLSHSLMTLARAATSGLEKLELNIRETSEIVHGVRNGLSNSPPAATSILALLDEYLSHLYVQYMGTMRLHLEQWPAPKGVESDFSYNRARAKLEKTLESLQEDEALRRMTGGGRTADEHSDLDRENRLVRLGHLKKFFQSKTFLNISRQQSAKKVSESTATIATAFAGITAALLEVYGRGYAHGYAWQGLSVICLGVIVYVLRDRMKDRAKAVFQEKALQFLPDFQQILMANNRRIGRVKEWFAIKNPQNLNAEIMKMRHAAAATEMERKLPEDVFHVRKVQEVDPAALSRIGELPLSRALYENTRVNFARYLKHMDNPFKDFGDIDSNGRLTFARSHRVYYFYLLVKTTTGPLEVGAKQLLRRRDQTPKDKRQGRSLLYRIVIDKNGVVRLEDCTRSAQD